MCDVCMSLCSCHSIFEDGAAFRADRRAVGVMKEVHDDVHERRCDVCHEPKGRFFHRSNNKIFLRISTIALFGRLWHKDLVFRVGWFGLLAPLGQRCNTMILIHKALLCLLVSLQPTSSSESSSGALDEECRAGQAAVAAVTMTCNIPRVPVSDISVERFVAEFQDQKPVIVVQDPGACSFYFSSAVVEWMNLSSCIC